MALKTIKNARNHIQVENFRSCDNILLVYLIDNILVYLIVYLSSIFNGNEIARL